jgi:hypothetical protein
MYICCIISEYSVLAHRIRKANGIGDLHRKYWRKQGTIFMIGEEKP